jgi:hypothetical protein
LSASPSVSPSVGTSSGAITVKALIEY